MRRFLLPALLALAPVALAPAAVASELRPKWIPADTQWVAHLDLEALEGSTLWKEIERAGREMHEEFNTKIDLRDVDFGDELPPEIVAQWYFVIWPPGSRLGPHQVPLSCRPPQTRYGASMFRLMS